MLKKKIKKGLTRLIQKKREDPEKNRKEKEKGEGDGVD